MGASKRYKSKACAYCGKPGCSSSNDHVVARAFFLEEDRRKLPQVPACLECNNHKSKIENYVAATLMMASEHPEANRYRQEKVRPRLAANLKLVHELRLNAPLEWVSVNGVVRQMKRIRIDASQVNELMRLIVKGLYCYHFGKPLGDDYLVDASMYPADREPALAASFSDFFRPESARFSTDLGRGSFIYTVVQSVDHDDLTMWQMAWHGGISLYGEDGESAKRWWAFTRPTQEAVDRAKSS